MVASQQWGLGRLNRNIDVLLSACQGEMGRERGNFCSWYNSRLSLTRSHTGRVKFHLQQPALPLLPEKSLTGEFLLLPLCKP